MGCDFWQGTSKTWLFKYSLDLFTLISVSEQKDLLFPELKHSDKVSCIWYKFNYHHSLEHSCWIHAKSLHVNWSWNTLHATCATWLTWSTCIPKIFHPILVQNVELVNTEYAAAGTVNMTNSQTNKFLKKDRVQWICLSLFAS